MSGGKVQTHGGEIIAGLLAGLLSGVELELHLFERVRVFAPNYVELLTQLRGGVSFAGCSVFGGLLCCPRSCGLKVSGVGLLA